MKITVERFEFTEKSTIGRMFIDGNFFCYTLEDKVRDVKIPKVTAIPTGTYKVSQTVSNRFKKLMPLLHDVPNFSGVRIHAGNKATDTDGCILVGYTKAENFIGDSQKAFKHFMEKIKDVKNITIEIK
jgi:hypothetical protein